MSLCKHCRYRGPTVLGSSHHISCDISKIVPLATAIMSVELLDTGTSFVGDSLVVNNHAIKNGWAMWPYNFDEIWIEKCNFKDIQNEQSETNDK